MSEQHLTIDFTYFKEEKAPRSAGRAQNRTERSSGELKEHRLTVGYIYSNQKEVPFIRLSGDWLNRQGFCLGKKIIVREQPGQLVLQVAEEANL